jgi:Na+/melibiose symporter-like transporter
LNPRHVIALFVLYVGAEFTLALMLLQLCSLMTGITKREATKEKITEIKMPTEVGISFNCAPSMALM